jgi:hypothetical protein
MRFTFLNGVAMLLFRWCISSIVLSCCLQGSARLSVGRCYLQHAKVRVANDVTVWVVGEPVERTRLKFGSWVTVLSWQRRSVSYRDAGGVREEPWWYLRFKVDESQAQRVALKWCDGEKGGQLLKNLSKIVWRKKDLPQRLPRAVQTTR